MDHLVALADLVVHGIIASRQGQLSRDEREIYTAHSVEPKEMLFQREAQATSRPEGPMPIIFKAAGGTVEVEGFPVTVSVSPSVSLNVGDEVILFGDNQSRVLP